MPSPCTTTQGSALAFRARSLVFFDDILFGSLFRPGKALLNKDSAKKAGLMFSLAGTTTQAVRQTGQNSLISIQFLKVQFIFLVGTMVWDVNKQRVSNQFYILERE